MGRRHPEGLAEAELEKLGQPLLHAEVVDLVGDQDDLLVAEPRRDLVVEPRAARLDVDQEDDDLRLRDGLFDLALDLLVEEVAGTQPDAARVGPNGG